ncbi:MAG TPA: type II secretion system protein N, partial [Steroidobacteraceae bacterium]|nr:type II secretion system protein N [Steroidobacteraceae bacterium]
MPVHQPSPAPDKQASLLGTDASVAKRLKLVLVATTPGGKLADRTAALGTDPRNPQVYAGGAVLSNGARIVDIQADRITLSLRGRVSTLEVDPGAASRAALMSATHGAPRAGPLIADGDPAGVGAAADAGASLAREPSSREDLSDYLRPQPVFDNDQLSGLMVLTGTRASKLASLDLESGDVIRSVAGVPV